MRLAKRFMAFVASLLLVGGMVSACASDEAIPGGTFNDAGKGCSVQFCPLPTTTGQACCTTDGHCGVDYGNGCTTPRDGG